MSQEKEKIDPQLFMVMGPKMSPLPITLMQPDNEIDNPLIINGFDVAVRFHNWLYQSGKYDKDNPVTVVEITECVPYDNGILVDEDFCALAERLSKIKEFGIHEQDYWDGKHWKEKANKLIELQGETMDKVDNIKCEPPPSMQCGH